MKSAVILKTGHGDAEEAGMGCRVEGLSARNCAVKRMWECTEIYNSGRSRHQQIWCNCGNFAASVRVAAFQVVLASPLDHRLIKTSGMPQSADRGIFFVRAIRLFKSVLLTRR